VQRERDGIPVDPETWRQILEGATRLGVSAESVRQIGRPSEP
jgi:hypothetical protein